MGTGNAVPIVAVLGQSCGSTGLSAADDGEVPVVLSVGFGLEDAQCRNTGEERTGLGGADLSIIRTGAHGTIGCCEGPRRCWETLQHLPVPITRTHLSSPRGQQTNHCRAEAPARLRHVHGHVRGVISDTCSMGVRDVAT